jgi:hypothetical protein
MIATDFHKALTEITKLESWDIASVLGSWKFVIDSAALNAAIRLMPNLPPEGSGIDAATQYNEDLRKVMNESHPEVASLVAMSLEVQACLDNHADVPPRSFEDTLSFLKDQAPTQQRFVQDYNRRKTAGIQMGISLREFVNSEMQVALRNHQNLLAKGSDAIVLLDKIAENQPQITDIPEWLEENLHQRAVAKMKDRHMRLELRRTNPRLNSEQRDEALASQMLIEKTIGYFGGEIIKAENFDSSEDDAAFIKELESQAPKLAVVK